MAMKDLFAKMRSMKIMTHVIVLHHHFNHETNDVHFQDQDQDHLKDDIGILHIVEEGVSLMIKENCLLGVFHFQRMIKIL